MTPAHLTATLATIILAAAARGPHSPTMKLIQGLQVEDAFRDYRK